MKLQYTGFNFRMASAVFRAHADKNNQVAGVMGSCFLFLFF